MFVFLGFFNVKRPFPFLFANEMLVSGILKFLG